jgi:hypothetical protein
MMAVTAAQAAGTNISDPATIAAFAEAVNQGGYNCPQALIVTRLDYQNERGQPFMVACSGSAMGLYYRVTVQPRGTAIVEPWK